MHSLHSCLIPLLMCSRLVLAADTPARKPASFFRDIPALADRWSTSAGDSLTIDRYGEVRFINRNGVLLDTAQVEILSWQDASNQSPSFVSTITLSFTTADTVCVIPGYFTAGEGDRCGLDLMAVPSVLGWKLREWYQLGQCWVLSLEGTPP